jgi:hypothetical protein
VSYFPGPGPSLILKVDFLVLESILEVPDFNFGVLNREFKISFTRIGAGPGDSSITMAFLLEGKVNLGDFFLTEFCSVW